MSHRLVFRPDAERELSEAFDWYEDRVSGLGHTFLLSVDASLNAILRGPNQFPCVHGVIRRVLTRRFPYEIFFIEDDDRIVVLAVFHAKRDPKQWRKRK